MRRLLIAMTVLFSIHACADNTTNKQTTSTTPQGVPMIKTRAEIFGEKPIYKIRIRAQNAEVVAKINGVTIYENFSGERAFALETVNSLITSHDNTMSITLSDEQKISPKAGACATLEVYAGGKHYVLNRVCIDMSQKEKTIDSTPAHEYSYDAKKGLVRDIKGKIEVGETILKPETMYRSEKQDGLKAVQSFSLPTPFPRWKFLDAHEIIDYDINYISDQEYNKLKKSPKIQALYALDKKIRDALKAKEPEKIIDLFQERFEEDAHAYYDTSQSLKQEFLNNWIEFVNNPNKEFIERKGDELYFVIEENKKLAWLKSIAFYDKESKIYSHFRIKYRLNKQGEWVITK